MSVWNKNKILKGFENHKKPTNRREFMGLGLMSGTGWVLAPSIVDILWAKKAYGVDCSKIGGGMAGMSGFLCFDLAGGASIAGSNVMVGKTGGQTDFLASYSTLGLPAAIERNVDTSMGLVFQANSAFLRGIRTGAAIGGTPDAVLSHVDGAVFCTASNDDTANNPHNPMYWINAAGAKGELVALVGTSGGDSGGRSGVPPESINPAARPVQIQRTADAQGLVNLGKLAELLTPKKAEKVLKAVEGLSASQLARFKQKDLPAQIKELVECGYIQSSEMIAKYQDPTKLDAAQDPLVTQAFGALTAAETQQTAAIAKLITDKYAGAGTVQLGGFDYHNGSRATGEGRDEAAGLLIGQSLKLAHLKQQNLVIYVFSDGSVTSNGTLDNSAAGGGKGVWTGDSGQRGAAFMLVYKAGEGKPEVRDIRQIGSFTDAGAVNTTASKISSNVVTLSKAVAANYLALHGREGELAKVVGEDPFGADLEQYLVFQKLV